MRFAGRNGRQSPATRLDGARHSSAAREFYPAIGSLLPRLAWGALVACTLGLCMGWNAIPPDARRDGLYAIVLIHVPAAWLSVCLYVLMASWAAAGLVLRSRFFAMMAQALAPTGAMFALLTLWTGSLWGKPDWGSWWDPRLAAELVMLLFYGAIIAARSAIGESRRGDRVVALIAIVGVVAVPGVLAIAATWREFHHFPLMPGGLGSAPGVVAGLGAMVAGLWMYATAAVLKRLRCVILEWERQSDWVERQSDWLARRARGGAR